MNEQDELIALLHRWLPQQRWYPVKGKGVSLTEVGRLDLPGPGDDVTVAGHLIGIDSGDAFDVVQVPLTHRVEPLDGAAPLGTVDGRHVYDGPHDPAYVAALLTALELAQGQDPLATDQPGTVLSGEQSNTSIIVGADSARPLIVKVFRLVNPGRNPDVEVVGALSKTGSEQVPSLVGWLEGSWTVQDAGRVTGDLAVATEFLPGSRDAWRVALEAAQAGNDFTDAARELGAATAHVHVELREVFGSTPAREQDIDTLIEGMRRRVDWALAGADALSPYRDALREHRDALSSLTSLPPLQRIHGDYHLGQVLRAPGRGWVLLDFEGEPLRPLAERTLPDLALRDVVGMLRSFDYAAGHVSVNHPDRREAAADWAREARAAFLQGYASLDGQDPAGDHPDLFNALWLDKALYEVVYETRNRPEWVPIPVAAVAAGMAG